MRKAPLKDVQVTIRIDEIMNNVIQDIAEEEDSPIATTVRKLIKEAILARGKTFDQKKDKIKK